MFKYYGTAILLLLTLSSFAQMSLSGIVRDSKTNEALAGATLQLEGTTMADVADEWGRFSFRLTPGSYAVRVSFVGYEPKAEIVKLSESTQIEIALIQSAILTEAVVVNATRATDKTPTTFTNVSKAKIQQQNFGQDLPFLLNWTPSVVTTSDAGTGIGYTGIRIRGSDATSINVTINGIPYNDSESMGTFWVNIPDIATSSESIQIQRGVGTSTNGAGAFGASINLQTNKRNDVAYAEVANSLGSFNSRRHSFNFGTGLLNNHWVIDGRVSKIASDGFIDRASADLQSYYFSAGFYTEKTIVKALMFGGKERTYQSWYGVPESRLNNDTEAMLVTASNEGWNEAQTNNLLNSGSRTFNPYFYENEVDDYKQDHYQLHLSQQLVPNLIFNSALHYTPGKGYYEQYKFDDDFSDYGLPPVTVGSEVIESADIIRRKWLENDFYGVTYSLTYDQNRWNVILGGAANRYEGEHYGDIIWSTFSQVPLGYRYYDNTGDKRDANVYLKANYQISPMFDAFVDLQYRKIDYAIHGIESELQPIDLESNYDFFNPKVGVTQTINDKNQLYYSFARSKREPTRSDFVDAPTTPKAERLHNLELGWRNKGKRHTLHVNYYLMDYKNQLVLTGRLNDVGAALRQNVDKSFRSGVEFEGSVRLSNKLQWNANFTLSRNKITEFTEVLYDYGPDFTGFEVVERKYEDTEISFSPSAIAGSSFSYFPTKGVEFTWLSKYVGRQYLDNTMNSRRDLDPYFVNDLRLSYSWKPKFVKEIAFSFLINNIFSELYESNGFTYGYLGGGEEYRENFYFPQAGRNFMTMISIKF